MLPKTDNDEVEERGSENPGKEPTTLPKGGDERAELPKGNEGFAIGGRPDDCKNEATFGGFALEIPKPKLEDGAAVCAATPPNAALEEPKAPTVTGTGT